MLDTKGACLCLGPLLLLASQFTIFLTYQVPEGRSGNDYFRGLNASSASCWGLGQSLSFSWPQFPHMYWGVIMLPLPASSGCCEALMR